MKRSWVTLGAIVLTVPILYGGCNPCGNGKLDTNEQCDDGNGLPGDGCSPQCKTETSQACTKSTATAMLAAVRAADPGYDETVTRATTLLLLSPTLDGNQVWTCSEGQGTTTWVARLPHTGGGNNPNGLVSVRLDAPVGLKTIVAKETGVADDVDVYFQGIAFRFTSTAVLILGANGIPTSGLVANVEPAPLLLPSTGGAIADGVSPGVGPQTITIDTPSGQRTANLVCSSPPAIPFTSCGLSQHAVAECMKEATNTPHLIGYGILFGRAVFQFAKGGGSPAVTAGYGVLLFGPSWFCLTHRPWCMTEDCYTGKCVGTSDRCRAEAPLTSEIPVYQCDPACQTCSTNASGEPACRGIEICSIDATPATMNGAKADVTVSYCGHVKPGATIGIAMTPLSCPQGWRCIDANGEIAASGQSPQVFDDWLGCSGSGVPLPASFTYGAVLYTVGDDAVDESSGVDLHWICQ